jgi:carbon monoxide dehydrogenase subunit G
MDMTGERRIPAPRQKVWDALNDPEVLKACIPGCESLEKTSDTDLKATAAVKIGPIAARFTGKVQLTDLHAPDSYRISGEGQGGVAGFAKGGANVRLSDDGADTLLQYDVKAQVGGKIAQLGARLIDATSKQMADMFFDRFTAAVANPAPDVPATAAEPVPANVLPPAGPDALAAVEAPQPAVERARARDAAASAVAAAPQTALSKSVATPTAGGEAPELQPPLHLPNAAPAAISIFAMIPKEPFGFPRIAFVGGALYLIIFVMIFKSYVFG